MKHRDWVRGRKRGSRARRERRNGLYWTAVRRLVRQGLG